MNKKDLSERDICTKFITPAIEKAGWDRLTQLLEEVSFTDGHIEKELDNDNFPTPEQLWQKYKKYKGIESLEAEKICQNNCFL
jgi:hypothetical protein